AVNLHAVRPQPPRSVLVRGQEIQQGEIRAVTQGAVGVDIELQNAVPDRLADVKSLLVRGDADSIGVVEVVCDLDPLTPARRAENDPADHCGWHALIGSEYGGIRASVRRDHDIVDAAVELPAFVIGVPAV